MKSLATSILISVIGIASAQAAPLSLFVRLVCAARRPRSFDRRWRPGGARHRRDIAWHEALEVPAAVVS